MLGVGGENHVGQHAIMTLASRFSETAPPRVTKRPEPLLAHLHNDGCQIESQGRFMRFASSSRHVLCSIQRSIQHQTDSQASFRIANTPPPYPPHPPLPLPPTPTKCARDNFSFKTAREEFFQILKHYYVISCVCCRFYQPTRARAGT